MQMATRDTTGRDGSNSGPIPDDLISPREAVDKFHIPYSTLMGWWNRGVIRRFKRGTFNLLSEGDVRGAVERYQTIREVPPRYTSGDGEADEPGDAS